MTTQYEIDESYSFNVFPIPIIGNNYKNVVVQAVLDANTAQLLGCDIQGLHKQCYSFLPAGTPNDPTKYQYLKLLQQNGSSTIIAVPWIDDSSVTQTSTTTIVATITGASPSDLSRVQLALAQNGFSNVQYTLQ
jgi:hypothetical protein